MKKRQLLFSAFLLSAAGAFAQSVPTHEMYVQYATPSGLVEALKNWEPGKNFGEGKDYKDENFFISRVPLKERFVPGDWANDDLNDSNDKYFCWCAPTGEMTKKWGPLPRYNFDGDNFNMWQYVNTHSNWSNGWWRVPGAFNDVAHRNGVRTGCTYFIDWATPVNSMNDPGKTLYELAETDWDGNYLYAEKLIKFMRYYGITGLTFNPEGNWAPNVNNAVKGFLAECHRVAKELNWPFHVDWYAFVSNTGQLSDNGCKLTVGANDQWFHDQNINQPVTDVFFLNYNWSDAGLQQSVNAAKQLGRNTFDVYAGFDMQGRGYGKNGNAGWTSLMKYPVSVVVWGAHDRSQLYVSSTEGGQSDYAVQNEYQKKQEMLFSGGNRNVLQLPALTDANITSSFSDLGKWHGYAKAVRERSTLNEVPFVTRFNLGNGRFFNDNGVTTWNHKWYNWGMQDMLPTWRWWIDNGDGKTVPTEALQVDFTYDDAWFGGSCLKLHGKTNRSDLRLFATRWNVANGADEFKVVYKIKSGNESHLKLMVAKDGATANFQTVALPAGEQDKWTTATFKASDFGLNAGDVIGYVGLSAEQTPANYEVLLGEMSFIPAAFAVTPNTPKITHHEVMKRFYNRADFKVVFDMGTPASRPAKYDGCPVYNEEVGAWYYEVFVKQGNKETLVTTTTSWAAYVVDAPLDPSNPEVQIGVRAVGLDGKTKSAITWSPVINKELTMIETLTIDKEVIKPGEEFTIGFEDPNHPACDFNIYNALTGVKVASAQGKLTMTTSLSEVGSYDVEIVSGGKSIMNRSIILISPEETGRLPQINNISVGAKEVLDTDAVKLTADINDGTKFNDAPCTVSQSLYMQEPYQFTVDANVMSEYTNNSYALWFKVEKFEHASLGTLLMTKVNRNYGGTWTESVWGEMWTAIRPAGYAKGNNLRRDNAENEISVCFDGPPAGTPSYEHNNDVDGLSDGYSLQPNTWYHICVVKNGRNEKVYLNGKLIIDCQARGSGPKNWRGAKFYVGGSMTNLASFTGWVDEVQIWSKSLTQAEVLEAMKGYRFAPDGLEGYFKFEQTRTDAEGKIYFPNMGKGVDRVAGGYMTIGKSENNVTTDHKQNQLTTTTGVPSLTGVFPIKYESSKWMVEGARVQNANASEAEAVFPESGEYPITVTASNSWGSVSKTITEYIVVNPTAIKDVNADNENGYVIYPHEFENKADVLFAEEGTFVVSVYNTAGATVANNVLDARAGEVKEISLGGAQAGTYVVVLKKDGKAVRSFKIRVK